MSRIATMEQRISERSEEEQKKAEEAATKAIGDALQTAFPSERNLMAYQSVGWIRAFVNDGAPEGETAKLKRIRGTSVSMRENNHRDELTSTLESLAWALEEVAGQQ